MGMSVKHWLKALAAAVILSVAGSLDSSLALMGLVPGTFNLGPGFNTTLKLSLVLGLLAGVKGAVAYLKQSPLPTSEATVTETQTKTTNVSVENK